MANPWNAGPSELPGDPENDPANYAQCDCCGDFWPTENVLRIMPGPHSNAPCETWACPVCRGSDEETDLPWCDSCRRQFGDPPKERNVETHKGGAFSFTCDICLEKHAMSLDEGPEWEPPE